MINILSLFDGCSGGQQAIDNYGIKNYNYFASEIDKYAIQVTKDNYPNTIHIGDIKGLVVEDGYIFHNQNNDPINNGGSFKADIDLLLGGSPCTNLSFAGKQKGLVTKENIEITTLEQYLELKSKGFEFEGQSYLFWEYIRILHEVKPRYFLLENVVMSKKWESVFNEAVGFESVKIDSSLVVAQNRKRLYWVGELQKDGTYKKVEISQPKDRGILLKDILEEVVDEKFYLDDKYIERIKNRKATQKPLERILGDESKSHCLTTRGAGEDHSGMILYKEKNIRINEFSNFNQDNVFCGKDDKTPTLTTKDGGLRPKIFTGPRIRKLTPIECERLQGIRDNYTACVSDTQRYKMIGNGWTIPVITHILSHLNLTNE